MKKFIWLCLAIGLCGCAKSQNIENKITNPMPNTGNEELDGFQAANATASERAEIIAKAVADLDGIEKASVIVTETTAIVGIETTGELNDAKLIQFKKDVEETVKLTDPGLRHVAVTAAPELVQRITNMTDTNGVQIHEDNEEFGELLEKASFQTVPTL